MNDTLCMLNKDVCKFTHESKREKTEYGYEMTLTTTKLNHNRLGKKT